MKRGDTYKKILAVMTEPRAYSIKELSQVTGIAEPGIAACLRGMKARREVKPMRTNMRGEPFHFKRNVPIEVMV